MSSAFEGAFGSAASGFARAAGRRAGPFLAGAFLLLAVLSFPAALLVVGRAALFLAISESSHIVGRHSLTASEAVRGFGVELEGSVAVSFDVGDSIARAGVPNDVGTLQQAKPSVPLHGWCLAYRRVTAIRHHLAARCTAVVAQSTAR
jgi:hypothetical protein